MKKGARKLPFVFNHFARCRVNVSRNVSSHRRQSAFANDAVACIFFAERIHINDFREADRRNHITRLAVAQKVGDVVIHSANVVAIHQEGLRAAALFTAFFNEAHKGHLRAVPVTIVGEANHFGEIRLGDLLHLKRAVGQLLHQLRNAGLGFGVVVGIEYMQVGDLGFVAFAVFANPLHFAGKPVFIHRFYALACGRMVGLKTGRRMYEASVE